MITKADLINVVADYGMTKVAAKDVVNLIFDTISSALQKGEEVTVHDFGKFSVKERAARTGRNPQTGATIQIAARKAPGFKAAKALKDTVNR